VKNGAIVALLLCHGLLSLGCVGSREHGNSNQRAGSAGPLPINRAKDLPAEVRAKILALDPEQVTESQIKELLAQAPAPRIIKIHGGPLPIKTRMNSFSRFLIAMGYPESSLRDPGTGSFTFGYYESSDKISGLIGWHYEREGLRPMIVGHSMGGIQAIRVLYKLAGAWTNPIPVWNPLTDRAEGRSEIVDPLTGKTRAVVGLQVCYATAVVAGGLGRFPPNEWDMNRRLRLIPDSVEEFTGFQKGFDIFGGDYLGYGSANDYRATGQAVVRNVRLPGTTTHWGIPDASGLLKDQQTKEWISDYRPSHGAVDEADLRRRFGLKSGRVLWAADVWFSIKKHWVLELQRLIRAGASNSHGN